MTQPQGHSTSGCHERYKPAERLDWESVCVGIKKMREWILAKSLPEQASHLVKLSSELVSNHEPLRRDVLKTLNAALDLAGNHDAAYWTRDYYNCLLYTSDAAD